MTDGQVGAVCPQCGSAAGVHSIQELAGLAQARLNTLQGPGGSPQPGGQGAQPGWAQEPQPGWAQEPQPGQAQGPQPGWAQEPRQGPLSGLGGWRGGSRDYDNPVGGGLSSIEDDIAGAALGAAARFVGRKIGRRLQNTLNEKVMPAVAGRQEEMLRTQIAIAERHPDLRACMTDQVIFLAGGSRVLPMKSISMTMTVEQSDALVAQLR